jgi:hypothetical protein
VPVVGEVIRALLMTRSLTTQEAKDADALPTAALRRNGIATAATVTVVDVGTGHYLLTATLAAGQGWLPGDHYALDATWTMEGTAGLAEIVLQGQVAPSVTVEAESTPDTDRTIRRGDTGTVAFTGLGNLTGRTKLWFTAKSSSLVGDEKAILQVTEADGLLVLNSAPAEDETLAAITVTDAAAGDLAVTIAAEATTELVAISRLRYDVQVLLPSGVFTLAEGLLVVSDDITRAIE